MTFLKHITKKSVRWWTYECHLELPILRKPYQLVLEVIAIYQYLVTEAQDKKVMRSEFRPKVVSTEFDLLNRR